MPNCILSYQKTVKGERRKKAPYEEPCDKKTAKPRFCLHPPRRKTGNRKKCPERFCMNMQFTGPKCDEYAFHMQIRPCQTLTAHRLPPASDLSEVCFQPVRSTFATCYVHGRDLSEAFRAASRCFFLPKNRQIFCQDFATILTLFHIGCPGFKISERHRRRAETSHSRAACQTKCHFVRRPKNLARTFHVPELFTTFVA